MRLFFLSSHHQHRDPHSFPTRRSSDLPTVDQLRGDLQAVIERNVGLRHDVLVFFPGREIKAVRLVNDLAALEKKTRDRKSTRLNSSHRCISYAVFCLKKKKKQKHRHKV